MRKWPKKGSSVYMPRVNKKRGWDSPKKAIVGIGSDPLKEGMFYSVPSRRSLREIRDARRVEERSVRASMGLTKEEIRRRYIRNRHKIYNLKKKYPEVDFDAPTRAKMRVARRDGQVTGNELG
jgi:hypothetical protein